MKICSALLFYVISRSDGLVFPSLGVAVCCGRGLSPLIFLWYEGGLLSGVDFVWPCGVRVCFWWLPVGLYGALMFCMSISI